MENNITINNRIPQLRFPGFTGEWQEKPLCSLAAKVNQKNKDFAVTRVLTNSATEGVVDQNAYFERDIAVKDNTNNYYIVDKDDFVYNPRISSTASVGPISINKVGQGYYVSTIYSFQISAGPHSLLRAILPNGNMASILKEYRKFRRPV